MSTATLTSKGQITIPKDVRDKAHLRRGDHVTFRVRDDGVVELAPASVDLMSLAGSVKTTVRGVSVEDMNDTIRDEGSRL